MERKYQRWLFYIILQHSLVVILTFKMGKGVSVVGGVGFVIALCGTIMLVVSIGTMYWRSPAYESGQIIPTGSLLNSGLFVMCTVKDKVGGDCDNIGWLSNAGATLTTTRVLLFMACVLIFVSIIFGIVVLCGHADIVTKGAMDIVIGIFILAGCSAYTAMTIIVDKYREENLTIKDFDWGFYICWASFLVFIIAGVCEVNGKKKATQKTQIHPVAIQKQMVWATTAAAGNGLVDASRPEE